MKSHIASGVVLYDPPRPKMKKRTKWWCVLNVSDKDGDIARYCRWQIWKKYGIELNPPSWGSHVSIIRGEEPKEHLKHLWTQEHGTLIKFEYSHEIYFSKGFFFCLVQSEFLMNIRKKFELPTNYPLHMTIGKLKDI